MRQCVLPIAATLMCLLSPSTLANEETGVSLRGSYASEDTDGAIEWQLSFLPLNLTLGSITETTLDHNIRAHTSAMDYPRPQLHFLPLTTKQEREIWGARILKTAVRYDFSAEDSLFDMRSALAIEWQSGAVGFVYETTTDLGLLARLKVEGQKVSRRDFIPTALPTPQSPLDVEIDTRVLVELVYRH